MLGLTVGQLRAALNNLPDDTEVVVWIPDGDDSTAGYIESARPSSEVQPPVMHIVAAM